MAKIKRPKVEPRYVVVDTSVLFHDDKSFVVNPTFETIWNETSQSIQISLAIPGVVKGELCYQQAKQALKSHEEILKNTNSISKITNHRYSCRIKSDKVIQQITDKFEKWCKSFSAEIIKTPIEEIDWEGMVGKSIWREPPFSKEGDKEKGFRDILILETLLNYIKKYPDRHVVFICGDRLLRDTAESVLKDNKRVTCFAKIHEFKTNVNLLREKLTLSFVDTILRKARNKFFKQKDKSCLFYLANIQKEIEDKFERELDNPKEELLQPTFLGGIGQKNWERVTGNYMYIGHPEFIKLENNDEFYWKTEISVVADFVSKMLGVSDIAILGQGLEEKNIRITTVEIVWKVNIDERGGFREMVVIDINCIKTEFRTKTKEDEENYYK